MTKRTSIFTWFIVALALVPAIVYAWLGQFSRPLDDDDYCPIAIGQELGAWDGMLHWYHNWSGAYSSFFFANAMAPLDTQVPRIVPALTIVLWLVGLSWLIFQVLTYLKIDSSRRPISVAIAALAVAASINAFHSPQAFYWYSANIKYALPLPLLAIYMALALWAVQRRRGDALSLLGIIAGAALCFISAGASEMFVVFQLTVLTVCLLASLALLRSSVRYRYALVFGVGWLATLGSLAIQLASPGAARRTAIIFNRLDVPDRSLSALMPKTFSLTLDYFGHPEIFAGFVMLMTVGLLVMLIWQLSFKPSNAAVRRFGLLALCSTGTGLLSMAAIIGTLSYRVGHIAPRVLTPSASLLALSGLVWGAFLGYLVKRYLLSFRWGQTWIKLLKLASLTMALIIGTSLILGQTAHAAYFRRYAQEWDKLHIEIIARRDRGQKIIEAAAWTYDMSAYLDVADWTNSAAPCAEDYYGVDLIRRLMR